VAQNWRTALLALALASSAAGAAEDRTSPPFFYRGYDYGSESQFNPITSFITYSFDTLQVPKSFGIDNWGSQRDAVQTDLAHPGRAIDQQGGRKAFVNRQILPIDLNTTDWIPNYALHVLGGGMVYRKNAEWFEAQGYAYPRLYAATLVTAAELVQEVVEKKSTLSDDEVADVYIFTPAGILLYSWDPFARFAADTLRLAEWPYQPMFNPNRRKLTNVGENFIARPAMFGSDAPRPFVYFGITTLLGASHAVNETDSFSWGVGPAVEQAQPLELRTSAGIFYDRNDSLLASLIVNGTENLAVRLNIYPGVIARREWWSPGVFVGIGRNGAFSVGLSVRVFPLGVSAGAP
jgi:hypothetical protein